MYSPSDLWADARQPAPPRRALDQPSGSQRGVQRRVLRAAEGPTLAWRQQHPIHRVHVPRIAVQRDILLQREAAVRGGVLHAHGAELERLPHARAVLNAGRRPCRTGGGVVGTDPAHKLLVHDIACAAAAGRCT